MEHKQAFHAGFQDCYKKVKKTAVVIMTRNVNDNIGSENK
jgi:hypothetical protein